MMRPESVALPPNPVADGSITWAITGNGNNRRVTLTWTDNSITETSYLIQRSTNGTTWTDCRHTSRDPGRDEHEGRDPHLHGPGLQPDDPVPLPGHHPEHGGIRRRVPEHDRPSPPPTTVGVNLPAAPTNLTATLQPGPTVSLTWRDNASNESGFVVERSTNGGAFAQIATPAARGGTGNVTIVDNAVTLGDTYGYRVTAVNVAGSSAPSNTASVGVAAPGQPVVLTGTAARAGANERVTLTWGDVANETSYVVQWSANNFATVSGQSGALAANSTTYTTGNIARQAWSFRVRAVNVLGTTDSAPFPVAAAP